jgi:hypothetical protein
MTELAFRMFGPAAEKQFEMKRMLSLALMCALAVSQSTSLGAQVRNSGVTTGTVLQADGVISGTVSSSSGRPLSDITMQLVDVDGRPVGKPVVTSRDGDFTFPPVAYDTYTLQCIQKNQVIGTSSIILKAATESVKMTCTSDAAPWWKNAGVVTGLVAAAAAVGAAAVVATSGDASGSR